MASSGIDFTGAIVVLPLGVMGDETQGVRVARHNVGSGNLSYTYPPGVRRELHMNNAFFLEGSCTLLDSEGEWCYDSSARSVHVWLDGCMDPSKLSFRGRVREYLLNATQLPSPGLRLERLTMWGGERSVSVTCVARILAEISLMSHLFLSRNVEGGAGADRHACGATLGAGAGHRRDALPDGQPPRAG
jgi:hypothetical protein